MAEFRLDDGVTMGKLNDPPHTDNGLRIYTPRENRIALQLRYEGWYLVRDLSRVEALKIINDLMEKLF